MRMRAAGARGAGKPAKAPQQRWVPIARISPQLKCAVLVAEDAAFYDHEGIDFVELRASIETKLTKGGVMRGARPSPNSWQRTSTSRPTAILIARWSS